MYHTKWAIFVLWLPQIRAGAQVAHRNAAPSVNVHDTKEDTVCGHGTAAVSHQVPCITSYAMNLMLGTGIYSTAQAVRILYASIYGA